MPKLYLTARARQRIIDDAMAYLGPPDVEPLMHKGKVFHRLSHMSPELEADIADFDKSQGQDIPPGAIPGVSVIQFQRCKLMFIADPSEFLIDTSEQIFTPQKGILRPV